MLLKYNSILRFARIPMGCIGNFQQHRSIFENSEKSKVLERIQKEIEESKKTLTWRTPFWKRSDVWQSKLQSFSDQEQNSDFILMMQQPIDLSPSAIKKWWKRRNERIERFMQQYIPERHKILGSDLAAAHFIVYRKGAVRFQNNPIWIKANEKNEFDLPNRYDPNWKLEAIRCDNMTLYYEGLDNLRNLQNLRFLSFHNVKTFDDWCLDRVSGLENPNLEILDVSGTEITYRGLNCLYRIPSLKLLIVDDPKSSKEMELSCAMLEEVIPALKICTGDEIHNIKV